MDSLVFTQEGFNLMSQDFSWNLGAQDKSKKKDNKKQCMDDKEKFAQLESMPYNNFVSMIDPRMTMKAKHSCAVSLSGWYQSLLDVIDRIVSPCVFSNVARLLEEASIDEDLNVLQDAGIQKVRKGRIFVESFSDSTLEAFLANILPHSYTPEYEAHPVSLIYTNDSSFDTNRIPQVDLDDEALLKKLIREKQFPINRRKIYFLKQYVRFESDWELHYYIFLPSSAFVSFETE